MKFTTNIKVMNKTNKMAKEAENLMMNSTFGTNPMNHPYFKEYENLILNTMIDFMERNLMKECSVHPDKYKNSISPYPKMSHVDFHFYVLYGLNFFVKNAPSESIYKSRKTGKIYSVMVVGVRHTGDVRLVVKEISVKEI